MKIIFFLCVLLLFSTIGKSQTIANEKMNIVYYGSAFNYISVSVPEYPCKSIILKVDTGELQTIGDGGKDWCGRYHYNAPSSLLCDKAIFSAYVQTHDSLKKVGESIFHIQRPPTPDVSVARKRNTEITISKLKANQYVFVNFAELFVCGEIWVDSFNYVIIRNNKPFHSGHNKGWNFDNSLKSYISEIENDDKILFYDIFAKGYSRDETQFNPFELKVVAD